MGKLNNVSFYSTGIVKLFVIPKNLNKDLADIYLIYQYSAAGVYQKIYLATTNPAKYWFTAQNPLKVTGNNYQIKQYKPWAKVGQVILPFIIKLSPYAAIYQFLNYIIQKIIKTLTKILIIFKLLINSSKKSNKISFFLQRWWGFCHNFSCKQSIGLIKFSYLAVPYIILFWLTLITLLKNNYFLSYSQQYYDNLFSYSTTSKAILYFVFLAIACFFHFIFGAVMSWFILLKYLQKYFSTAKLLFLFSLLKIRIYAPICLLLALNYYGILYIILLEIFVYSVLYCIRVLKISILKH